MSAPLGAMPPGFPAAAMMGPPPLPTPTPPMATAPGAFDPAAALAQFGAPAPAQFGLPPAPFAATPAPSLATPPMAPPPMPGQNFSMLA